MMKSCSCIFLKTFIVFLAAVPALAQSFDRSVVPPAEKSPELHVPAWTKETLGNQATLIVSERHELPLVSVSLTFLGGALQFERSDRIGSAGMTVTMLSEGTTSKTGDQLADAQQMLGTRIQGSMGPESSALGFLSTKSKFDPMLMILADMLLNPSFPSDSLERLRAQSLVGLTLAKNRPESISGIAFPYVLYSNMHPYGRRPTEEAIKAITRQDIIEFHKTYFQPARAIFTVVGDVDAKIVKQSIESAFSAWTAGGEKPTFSYPSLPQRKATTIYLIDKPGSAQSIVAIGVPGPPRNTPDYFPLQVLNRILGGQFQSRLNHNIREIHGYSYGVASGFGFGKGPGAFRAGGAVVSDKTDASLVEFMKELRGVIGELPISDEELKTSKEGMIQELPANFGPVARTAAAITDLVVQDLPADYYQKFSNAVMAVTKEDLVRVAKAYIDIDHLVILIVGDRASIETPLKMTGIAPIELLDIDGQPIGKP